MPYRSVEMQDCIEIETNTTDIFDTLPITTSYSSRISSILCAFERYLIDDVGMPVYEPSCIDTRQR